ncbi:MAG: hypothetical protein LBG44_11455 [Gemmatimonadota bacterium]|jgi:hypothetical protein|nr:hypothetical protein [Gemmatimonadota bacterium]
MKKRTLTIPLFAIAAAAAPIPASWSGMLAPDHFKLLEPVSWLVEDERGDPQKSGPCGGSNTDWGTPSYVVNEAVGGSEMHLALLETIYHPGFYRVALAVNSPNELPPDPVAVTRDGDRGPISVSGEIQNPAAPPILADGLFQHDTRPASPQTYEADILLPNINCDHCTLQVIQFMNEHGYNNPGGYTYHHCANIRITADPSKPIDTRWPAQRTSL